MPTSDLLTPAAAGTHARTSKKEQQVGAGFRPDIEGLRAVAIGLVLLYHGGVDQLTGGFVGVDVFFVISGFLITGLLIRELEKSGRISLSRFYARRAKRLLPATALVLVVTALLTWLTISVIDWRTFGVDIITAALYVVNWQLAARSVDYLAEDVGVSPVQHFWSLAVEEQFYIVWPLLLVVIAWWVRRRTGARLRVVMTAGILLIVVPSLLYSIYLTGTNQATAFFVTPTRLWEMGIGAFVAIGSGLWPRLPRLGAAVLGWAGLAAVGISGLIFSATSSWPGYHALLPTLGTAAVIVAGFASGRAGPALLLSWRPAVWVGGLSYSLYLWHWPLIICATAYWGELGTKRGLLVMLASFVPAYLCYRFVENPIRFAPAMSRSNKLTLSIGANCTLIGVVAGLVLALAVPAATTSRPDSTQAQGAAVLTDDAPPTTGGDGTVASLATIDWYVPDAVSAPLDVPIAYDLDCQVQQDGNDAVACEYGDPSSDFVVVVVGDSKILQWDDAFREIADQEGWRVLSYTKSACAFADAVRTFQGSVYTACTEWNAAVMDELEQLSPDLVITSQGGRNALVDPEDPSSGFTSEAMVDGLVSRWATLTAAGSEVAVVLDNPMPSMDAVYECVAENPDDLASCTFDRDEAIEGSAAPVQLAAAEQVPGVAVVDLTHLICPEDRCVPIIGNVLVYRQGSHITNTYALTATEALRQQLEERDAGGAAAPGPTGDPTADEEALGAAAIGSVGTSGGDGSLDGLASVEWWLPKAEDAEGDVSPAYGEGCQVPVDGDVPVACEYGDPGSEIVVAVVGDSKMLQWDTPMHLVAEEQGWRVVSYTKSACSFADAVRRHQGAAYVACTEWNTAVMAELEQLEPDIVVTSQGARTALEDPDDLSSLTEEAMVDGLVARWEALLEDSVDVAVVIDTPQPTGGSVDECVAEHPDDLAACTFPRDDGMSASSAPVQQAALAQVPAVGVVDLTPVVCPTEECVPVIGNVLVFRYGSHITNTYARTVAEDLSAQLVPLVEAAAA